MTKENSIEVDVAAIMAGSQEEIRKQVVQASVDGVTRQLTWKLENEIDTEIKRFFTEDVLPDLTKELREAKPKIIAQLREGVVKSAALIGDKMFDQAKKTIEGYKGERLLKELMGG